jgi:hypothetical protein
MAKYISFIFVFFCFLPQLIKAQANGRIMDQSTGQNMPFVHVVNRANKAGTSSDIDGKFKLLANPGDTLHFSFVGYDPLEKIFLLREEMNIFLSKKAVSIDEVIIRPGINPAHRIIRNAIDNKDQNNPEKNIGYRCNAYNKLLLTAEPDSILLKDEQRMAKMDSSDLRALDFFEGQHLLVMESITERRFSPPGKHHERIKASRLSGLQSPDFALLATQIQSFSFYEELISVLSTNYLSPLSNGAIRKYAFELVDTQLSNSDSVFVVAFQPGFGKNFQGLSGLLYINSNGFAIQNVIAQPSDTAASIQIEIRQKYEFLQNRKWFPVQLSSRMVFKDAVTNGFPIIGIGKSYMDDIQLDPVFSRKDFGQVFIQIDPLATKQPDAFWDTYRRDSLDLRELKTYTFMDSVGKAEKLDQKMKIVEALFDGKWRLGVVDIDLNKFLNYNNYEGFRLGAGLHTNDRISRLFKIGGYGAYGFNDQRFKYGGDIQISIRRMSETSIQWSSSLDVAERGGHPASLTKMWLSEDDWYRIYINKMDEALTHQLEFKSQLPFFSQIKIGIKQQNWHITDEYRFAFPTSETITLKPENWVTTSVYGQLRFAFKESWIQTMNKRQSLGTKWPVFSFTFEQGINGMFNGDLSFTKLHAQFDYVHEIPLIGEFSIKCEAGKVDQALPSFMLFNFKGSKSNFGLVTPNAFETMSPGKYFANEFVSISARHNFKNYLISTGNFSPHFILVQNMGWGSILESQLHLNGGAETLEKGYFESGLEIRNLLVSNVTGLGLGFFYRYGNYASGDFLDDAAIKLSASFAF